MWRRSSGRSHCGVKSLAKACVIPQNDGAQSLTATGKKHVNTLTDACYTILKGCDDFLVDWAFTELPQFLHQMKAQKRREKDKNKLAKLLCNSLPRHEGHHVFVRGGVAVKITIPGQRWCLPLLEAFNLGEEKYMAS